MATRKKIKERKRKKKSQKTRKSSSKGSIFKNNKWLFIALILSSVGLTFFLIREIVSRSTESFNIYIIALFIGVLVQQYRLSKNWKSVIISFLKAYAFSLIIFIPDLSQNYSINVRLNYFPLH